MRNHLESHMTDPVNYYGIVSRHGSFFVVGYFKHKKYIESAARTSVMFDEVTQHGPFSTRKEAEVEKKRLDRELKKGKPKGPEGTREVQCQRCNAKHFSPPRKVIRSKIHNYGSTYYLECGHSLSYNKPWMPEAEEKYCPLCVCPRKSVGAPLTHETPLTREVVIEAANRQFGPANWMPVERFGRWVLPAYDEAGEETIFNVVKTERGIEFVKT